MKHLALFHGMGATSKDQWLPFIGGYFTKKGWQVDAPDIPDSDRPKLDRWVDFVSEKVKLTPETTLVGHSAGCPLIMTLLERADVKIVRAILVAGFIENIGYGVSPLIQDSYNWEKIRANCASFFFINSDNDPYGCDDSQGRIFRNNLGGTQIIISGEGHFGSSEFNQPYPEFPLLAKLIET